MWPRLMCVNGRSLPTKCGLHGRLLFDRIHRINGVYCITQAQPGRYLSLCVQQLLGFIQEQLLQCEQACIPIVCNKALLPVGSGLEPEKRTVPAFRCRVDSRATPAELLTSFDVKLHLQVCFRAVAFWYQQPVSVSLVNRQLINPCATLLTLYC